MSEKCIVTTYEKEEFISIMRQAFAEELKDLLKSYQNQLDQDLLLDRKEAAKFLKISIRTLSTYQDSGLIPHYKLGRGVYFKKGELISALEGSDKARFKYLKKWCRWLYTFTIFKHADDVFGDAFYLINSFL